MVMVSMTKMPSRVKTTLRRFAPPADGQIPGDAGQDRADGEVPEPVRAIRVQDREQLVAAGKAETTMVST